LVGVGLRDFAGRGWAHEAGWSYDYVQWINSQDHFTLGRWWRNPVTGTGWDGYDGWPTYRVFEVWDILPNNLKVSEPGQPEAPLNGATSGTISNVEMDGVERPYQDNNVINGLSRNHLAVRFRGFLEIEQNGEYHFFLTTGSQGRLKINNSDVILIEDGGTGPISRNGTINLTAGRHEIEASFSFGFFGQAPYDVPPVGLEYQGPGMARQEIPAARVSHVADRKRTVARAMFDEWIQRNNAGTGHLTSANGTVLANFLHGGSPSGVAQGSGSLFSMPGGLIRFTIPRVRVAEGLTHELQSSTDLLNWVAATGYTKRIELAEPGFERWYFERSYSPGEPVQYLRLRSTLARAELQADRGDTNYNNLSIGSTTAFTVQAPPAVPALEMVAIDGGTLPQSSALAGTVVGDFINANT
ncbi:MAG: hypothetical protein ACKOLA_08545, partial [Spartobacteria bacterium]